MPDITDIEFAELEKLRKAKKKQIDRQNKFISEKYDRIGLVLPKGMKAELESYYRKKEFRSMNDFVVSVLKEELKKPVIDLQDADGLPFK